MEVKEVKEVYQAWAIKSDLQCPLTCPTYPTRSDLPDVLIGPSWHLATWCLQVIAATGSMLCRLVRL